MTTSVSCISYTYYEVISLECFHFPFSFVLGCVPSGCWSTDFDTSSWSKMKGFLASSLRLMRLSKSPSAYLFRWTRKAAEKECKFCKCPLLIFFIAMPHAYFLHISSALCFILISIYNHLAFLYSCAVMRGPFWFLHTSSALC